MNKQTRLLLKQHRINITRPRAIILESFLNTVAALDYNYFLQQPFPFIDRTTVFRTLNLFVQKKIIYRIPATDGITRYLLQSEQDDASVIDHCSFICTGCSKVMQLNTPALPLVNLPGGYALKNIEIVIMGLCKSCGKPGH